jgi:exodeoxyribonuclease V gamma subunit
MAGISLYRSNSLERLAELFCRDVVSDPLPPLEKEHVLVQSIGMGRWLSLSASENLGIWANAEYLYPNAFLDLVFRSVIDDYRQDRQISKQIVSWRIMEELPLCAPLPVYSPLAGYIGDGSVIKLFQLSEKIADMYDQYIASRPEMMLCWDRGEDVFITAGGSSPLAADDRWQSDLWRRVRSALVFDHRGEVRDRFLKQLAIRPEIGSIRRISVFGTSTLPPFHAGILRALSSAIQVNIYLLSPTRHYWGDIASERAQIRIERKRGRVITDDEHYSEGNALLSSMGDLGREFSDILSFCSDYDRTGDTDFSVPDDGTLLHQIQADICELNDRAAGDRGTVLRDDRSIQIHSCHSVMREVEVLRDNLLELFNADASLQPRDILVMTPDIDLYAPYIEAVFGAPETEKLRIPYSIADRNVRVRSTLIAPFLSVLALNEKRFTASAVFDLICSVHVREKMDFSDDDLNRIRDWMSGAGIRWGLDARDREIHCGVSFSQNSFVEGLRRLISGYAMRDEGILSDGILPAEFAEGSSGELLGSFAGIVETLASFACFMRESHPVAEWAGSLSALFDILFEPGTEGKDEAKQIRDTLLLMHDSSRDAGFTGVVDYRVVRDYLVSRLDETKSQFGFLNGRATFCAILPMRSIPFKIICIMGMNDGAFPRVSRPLSFDLIARNPVKGDRSQRKDDRYLFLETILSARSVLYISHIGRSIRDNSAIPPSVLVSELLDYIAAGYSLDGSGVPAEDAGREVTDHLVTSHRLHSFSRDYFSGRNLFSFSPSARSVAAAVGAVEDPHVPFLEPLDGDIPSDLLHVDPASLLKFFSNPARFFLRRRLGVIFDSGDGSISDGEPFVLDSFLGVALQENLVGALLEHDTAEKVRTRALHGGSLPPGSYGEYLYSQIEKDAGLLAEKVRPHTGTQHVAVRVCFESEGVKVEGNLPDVTDKGLMEMRGQLWGRDNFQLWLSHLLLCVSAPQAAAKVSVFITLDGGVSLPPLSAESAAKHLRTILALYKKGLRSPLKFFPKSSYAYARGYYEKNEDDPKRSSSAMKDALARWAPSHERAGRPEKDDPCFNFCFGAEPPHLPGYPLDDDFASAALDYFGDFFLLKEDIDGAL